MQRVEVKVCVCHGSNRLRCITSDVSINVTRVIALCLVSAFIHQYLVASVLYTIRSPSSNAWSCLLWLPPYV